jgi:nitroreductase
MEALRHFDQPIFAVIQGRSSRRSYEERPLEPRLRESLSSFLAEIRQGPFGSGLRLALCEARGASGRALRGYGTYGMIQGARSFIVGAVTKGPSDLEDFGYGFELAILRATDLGLGTCWLGGTLDRSLFGDLIRLRPSERLPAVSPVGHATARRALRDQVVRLGARSATRKPAAELFFDGAFDRPLSMGAAGLFAECLEAVRLGPSASNMQPWRILRDGRAGVFHFFCQRARTYTVPDGLGLLKLDLQRADMGIALCHFSLVAGQLGLHGRLEVLHPAPEVGPLPPRMVYRASFIQEEG